MTGKDSLGFLLDLQRHRQVTSFGIKFSTMTAKEREEFIRWNVLALVDELMEALAEVSWKPWAKGEKFNRDLFLGELIDAQHFLNNLYLITGATSDEIVNRYTEKSRINAARQANGYDGDSTKCPICRRALDDPWVTCGGVAGVCTAEIPFRPWPAEGDGCDV